MALMERVTTLVRANLNDLIDKAEDPEKMIKQVILDMENQLLQVKTQVAISMADLHLLQKKQAEQLDKSAEWMKKASRIVEHDDTWIGSPSAHAPSPLRAQKSSPVAGLWTTPVVTCPSSSRAMSTAQIGMCRTKFLVPSMGSMIQRRDVGPSCPNSSPRKPQSGKARPRTARMTCSASRSAWVTGV